MTIFKRCNDVVFRGCMLTVLLAVLILSGCGKNADSNTDSANAQQYPKGAGLAERTFKNNESAYVPAQCYTKTRGGNGALHNPCYACHTVGQEPNFLDDSGFQLAYDFRDYTRTNRWVNLFKDRTTDVAAITDEFIQAYVRESNYFDADGRIKLAQRLSDLPKTWDFNGDGKWNGYVPDVYFKFDQEGFDRRPDNTYSGWRAFGYTPFLGTFWPTNGSTDDVLIRLPEAMRQNASGEYDHEVYKLNLAIVEAMIKRQDISIDKTDETLFDVDLDRDGELSIAEQITYRWAPKEQVFMDYVGLAKQLQADDKLHLAAGLYPEGTEFLHTVRYVDVDDDSGNIKMSARIKEVRYGQKASWNNYSQLYNAVMGEEKEAVDFPGRLRSVGGNLETGVINGLGWVYQGFIEDKQGALRPQSYEELVTCAGCHSGVGATTDSSFAFPRKLKYDSFQQGWYHWTQKGLQGIPEPQWKDGTWEYSEYLKQNQSGNEFRNNLEVVRKFFHPDNQLKEEELVTLHNDIGHLLLPSPERALTLNKAYKVIVDEQSYIYGRDPHVAPVENVWEVVPENEATGIPAIVVPK